MLHQLSNTKLLVLLSGTLIGGALLSDSIRQNSPEVTASVPTTTTLLSDHLMSASRLQNVAEGPFLLERLPILEDPYPTTWEGVPYSHSSSEQYTDIPVVPDDEEISISSPLQPDTQKASAVEDSLGPLTSDTQHPPAEEEDPLNTHPTSVEPTDQRNQGETVSAPLQMKYYQMERGSHIIELQRELGMGFVDGIYGPKTHQSHVQALGGPSEAVKVWMNQRQWEWALENPDIEENLQRNWDYEEPPTLEELIHAYFLEEDWKWALAVTACESSAKPTDTYNYAVSSAHAKGAFQHLQRYWNIRRHLAGMDGWDIFDLEANVAVASWLFYTSGPQHWNPSKHCWAKKVTL